MTIFPANERTSSRYTGQIVDEVGVGVPASLLVTLTLTLFDDDTGAIINSRNHQNVLNANGVSVDSVGMVVWIIDPLDVVVLSGREIESHTAVFAWTWSGSKAGNHSFQMAVANARQVP